MFWNANIFVLEGFRVIFFSLKIVRFRPFWIYWYACRKIIIKKHVFRYRFFAIREDFCFNFFLIDVQIFCFRYKQLCSQAGITGFPTIRLFFFSSYIISVFFSLFNQVFLSQGLSNKSFFLLFFLYK